MFVHVDPTPLTPGFTPLEFGKALLDDLTAVVVPLPGERYATLGNVVVSCESLIVSSTGVDGQQLSDVPQCDVVQIGGYVISLARECSNVANDDGTTNVAVAETVSVKMDKDAETLWNWAQGLEVYITKDYSVAWVITGGLAITTLSLTVGIP